MSRISLAKIKRKKASMQKKVLDKFGQEVVRKARQRLCNQCSILTCSLLPLCLDGSDCPYFRLAVQPPLLK
jgi:hypothetical protein